MTVHGFQDGIFTLMAYYYGFEFNLQPKPSNPIDSIRYKLWYEMFEELSDEDFMVAIKSYCYSNIYAPTSPTPIVDIIKKLKAAQIETVDEAWELVSKNLSKGVYGYLTIDENGKEIRANPFLDALRSHPVVLETVKGMMTSLASVTTDNKAYIQKEFKTIYERNIEKKITLKLEGKLMISE